MNRSPKLSGFHQIYLRRPVSAQLIGDEQRLSLKFMKQLPYSRCLLLRLDSPPPTFSAHKSPSRREAGSGIRRVARGCRERGRPEIR